MNKPKIRSELIIKHLIPKSSGHIEVSIATTRAKAWIARELPEFSSSPATLKLQLEGCSIPYVFNHKLVAMLKREF